MKKSISTKLLVGILIPVILGLLILAFTTLYLSSNAIGKLTDEDLMNKSLEANYRIDSYFKGFINSVNTVSKNIDVVNLFTYTNKTSKMKTFEDYNSIVTNLSNYKQVDSDILAYWLADIDGSELTYDNKFTSDNSYIITERPWYKQLSASERGVIVTSPFTDTQTGKEVVTVVTFAKNNKGENIGTVGLLLDISTLKNHMGTYEMGETGHFVFVAEDNKIVYADGSREKYIGEEVDSINEFDSKLKQISTTDYIGKFEFYEDEKSVMGYKMTSDKTGWSTYSSLPTKEFNSASTTLIYTSVAIVTIILALLVLIIIFISRGITKPIKQLNNVAIEIAEGKLDTKINISSKDEIGILADSLKKTVDRLNEYVFYINKTSDSLNMIAEGDLTFDVDVDNVEGAFEKVLVGFINIKDKLSHTINTVKDSADQISMSADELSVGAQNLSQSSVEQASSTQELTASIIEVSNSIRDNSVFVEDANSMAKNTLHNVNNGSDKMQELVQAMDEIRSSSSEIEKIIKTIEDIAFQTNILALNAAVEAARAGEAGKGFAVVADEVRNLAVKSAEAAKNTNKLIGATLESISGGTDIMASTVESLDAIIDNANNLAVLIDKINNANKLQSEAAVQIESGIEQISDTVQTNSATAEETAASSEELSSQAKLMNDMMQDFKVEVE